MSKVISSEEIKARIDFYKMSYHNLLNLHKKHPSVTDVALYMMVTLNEEPEKILEILKIMEKENES